MAKQLRNLLSREDLERRIAADSRPRTTLSFYQYAHIDQPGEFRNRIYADWEPLGVLGRVYVAREGINGQISVPTEQLNAFREALYAIPFLSGIRLNIAIEAEEKSFLKLTIKVRKKIVADGLDDSSFDVTQRGRHLDAQAVNDLMNQEDTLVVDMRNHYESEVGYFEGAIRPEVDTFREALPVVEEMLQADKERDIIMYCTGGIRCEKSTNYLISQGVEEVFHLKGGILKYLEQIPQPQSQWRGDCFVFDGRVSVSHGLAPGPHELCYACRRPILAQDKASPLYDHGVSCPRCADETTEDQKARFRERQKQVALAQARGKAHIGTQQS